MQIRHPLSERPSFGSTARRPHWAAPKPTRIRTVLNDPSPWIKAHKSNGSSNCVELRRNGSVIELRNSKIPDGPGLEFTGAELDAFVDGAGKGEFNHLIDDLV